MDLQAVKFSEESMNLVLTLRLKAELNLGKRVKKVETIEQLLSLLKFSSKSKDVDTKTAFENFVKTLTAEQVAFFHTLGLNTSGSEPVNGQGKGSAGSTYRGAHVLNKGSTEESSKASAAEASRADPVEKQRKKKMYRGREVL